MTTQPLHVLSAHALARKLDDGEISAVELTRAVLDRIDSVEDRVAAYLVVDREGALSAAEQSDRRRRDGASVGPLDGIPVAIKANMCARGLVTSCGSRILEHFVPPYDATVVARLRAAGAVPLGMANMDEFAMGSSTENSAFKRTRNPWDLDRVPGGSSGGSAAAVAAGEATLALGSDTGGSIRQPAALCGIVGMKPTYGRVSRYGLVAFASSLDQIGPMTRDVRDNALLLSAIAGHDPGDSTSLPGDAERFEDGIEGGVKGLRIGLVQELLGEGIAPEVRDAVRRAADFYRAQGAEVAEVSLPTNRHGIAAYYLIATAEASSNLARFDGVKYGYRAGVRGGSEEIPKDLLEMYMKTRAEGFGAEVKRRIMLGTYALSSGYYDAYYKKAQQVRTRIRQDFERAFQQFDVLLTPTTPSTAFKLGEKTSDPLAMYLADIATVTVNLAGVPALAFPGGFDAAGLPIGLQLIGQARSEATLYRAAHTYEQAHDFHTRRPQLAAAARV